MKLYKKDSTHKQVTESGSNRHETIETRIITSLTIQKAYNFNPVKAFI